MQRNQQGSLHRGERGVHRAPQEAEQDSSQLRQAALPAPRR